MSCPRRLFLGNFDFEAVLAGKTGASSRETLDRNDALSAAWLAVAQAGDQILVQRRPAAGGERLLEQIGRAGVQFVTAEKIQARDLVAIPWGWETRIEAWVRERGLTARIPPLEVTRRINSRAFSYELETKFGCGSVGQRACATLEEALATASELGRWLIKANFGAAGRERLRGEGVPNATARPWIERRLERDGVVCVEPWLERIQEAGVQWELFGGERPPELQGVTPLIADERGQYRGSVFRPLEEELAVWEESVAVSRRAAECIADAGYFGPLGIDAMLYRDGAGGVRHRPLQDINARWTMGRISLGWRERPAPGEFRVFLAGRQDENSSWAGHARLSISPNGDVSAGSEHRFFLARG